MTERNSPTPTTTDVPQPDFRHDVKPGAAEVKSLLRRQGKLGRQASVVIAPSGRAIDVVTDSRDRLQVPHQTSKGVPVNVRANGPARYAGLE